MRDKIKKTSVYRILTAIVCVLIFFAALIFQLVKIQIIQASELSAKQDSYMLSDISITASRGDIYDSNMNLLAKDASCSMICAFPNSIENAGETAKYLSEILNLDYEEVYNRLSDTSSNYVYIKKGVDNTTALEIQKKKIAGIEVGEDQKRYYTDSAFAQYVLGFTGSDHVGLYGLEAAYNDVLKGSDGIKSVLTDTKGNVIESSSSVTKKQEKGNSIVTTIDNVIQYYAESIVYTTYLTNKPKRVMALVTDVNTGEILAASVYPGYSLEDPWEITDDYKKAFSKDIKKQDESETQLAMWKNPFTMFIYEPGSTFKLVTASAALETGAVNADTRFSCHGYLSIEGVTIKCHVYPGSHGTQDLRAAVKNSCNVAMMNIVQRIGSDSFYEYLYNFGFGDTTGVNWGGEETGILTVNEDVNIIDFVTLGFGQGIGVTPIQLVSALNAVSNGGYLMKPYLVKYVLDSETSDVVSTYEPQKVRSVISEETSKEICSYMNTTANNYYYLRKYKDYKIGGKTGTAQKFENGKYLEGQYVASFYGMIPYDDPKISVLVLVDEPSGAYNTGAATAAPVAAKLLVKSYNYLQTKEQTDISKADLGYISVPDLRGYELKEAVTILSSFGIQYTLSGDEQGVVVDQSNISERYSADMVVSLKISQTEGEEVIVPNVLGMSAQNASEAIEAMGLKIETQGGGIAVKQSVKAGSKLKKGDTVKVSFDYVE